MISRIIVSLYFVVLICLGLVTFRWVQPNVALTNLFQSDGVRFPPMVLAATGGIYLLAFLPLVLVRGWRGWIASLTLLLVVAAGPYTVAKFASWRLETWVVPKDVAAKSFTHPIEVVEIRAAEGVYANPTPICDKVCLALLSTGEVATVNLTDAQGETLRSYLDKTPVPVLDGEDMPPGDITLAERHFDTNTLTKPLSSLKKAFFEPTQIITWEITEGPTKQAGEAPVLFRYTRFAYTRPRFPAVYHPDISGWVSGGNNGGLDIIRVRDTPVAPEDFYQPLRSGFAALGLPLGQLDKSKPAGWSEVSPEDRRVWARDQIERAIENGTIQKRPMLLSATAWIRSFQGDRATSPEDIALIARLIEMPGMAANLTDTPKTLVIKEPLREAFLSDMLALLEGDTSRLPVSWLPEFVDLLGRVEASETERDLYGVRWKNVLDTGSQSPMPVDPVPLIFAAWKFGVDPVPYLSRPFEGDASLGAERNRFEALLRGVCATHPNQRGLVLPILAEAVREYFETNPDMQDDRAWAERVWAPGMIKDALLVLWLAGQTEQVEALIAIQPVAPSETILQQMQRPIVTRDPNSASAIAAKGKEGCHRWSEGWEMKG